MGVSTLFFGQRKNTFINFLKVDVLTSETITFDSEQTQLPIEFGFEITDHVILGPTKISASFLISDSHVNVGGAVGGRFSRATAAYEELKIYRQLKLPIVYVSNLEVFPTMGITSLSVPRNVGDGDSLNFDITLQEVRILTPLGLSYPTNILSPAIAQSAASLVTL